MLSRVGHSSVRLVLVAIVTALMLVQSAATASAESTLDFERELISLINAERHDAGLSTLLVSSQLTSIARDWSSTMADRATLAHNPDLADAVSGNWRRLGENVGVGSSVSSLHNAFMDSPGHAANVLGDWEALGVGFVQGGGRLWVTVNFVKGTIDGTLSPASASTSPATTTGTTSTATVESAGTGPFRDVAADDTHAPGIAALLEAGITNGCTEDRFCPTESVSRAQMASYVVRALGLGAARSVELRDVADGSVHAEAIDTVVTAGIIPPCAVDEFCPDEPVLRGDMAGILSRALGLPLRDTGRFTDVTAGTALAAYVGAIADAGITTGCTPDRYCPDAPVTRAEMATFFARALDLI